MNNLFSAKDSGGEMYQLAKDLFPICRSITGEGVRQTLTALGAQLPGLRLHEVSSGTQVFDWTVPEEWNIRGARLLGPDGQVVVDFADHNLHVVGYSEPVDVELSLDELQEHLYSLPDQPDAIPYVTSYYKRRWGFCLTHRQREGLKPGQYRAVIDSSLEAGSLTYAELLLPGESKQEILVSTYVCHPSMGNNELSGPVVTAWLAKWLMQAKRRYSYRIIFIPETIGSITYLSKNLAAMKPVTIAGFNVSCVGDDRCYSFLPTRNGKTVADKAAKHVLKHIAPDFISYTYLDRGSDERQYNAPGVDLPVCSVMRSKYGQYPEYHTSLDNLDLISPTGLAGALNALQLCLTCLENNETLRVTVLCEPQLGKRGLYPTISSRGSAAAVANMMHMLAYCDGSRDLLSIAEVIGCPMWELLEAVKNLKQHGLLEVVD